MERVRGFLGGGLGLAEGVSPCFYFLGDPKQTFIFFLFVFFIFICGVREVWLTRWLWLFVVVVEKL